MSYIEIRCQEPSCEYGKRKCCFGELDVSKLKSGTVIERHKCKANKKKFVLVKISALKE